MGPCQTGVSNGFKARVIHTPHCVEALTAHTDSFTVRQSCALVLTRRGPTSYRSITSDRSTGSTAGATTNADGLPKPTPHAIPARPHPECQYAPTLSRTVQTRRFAPARTRSQQLMIASLSSGGMYGMVPLPTHITMRAYAGPFDARRSQICEELYLTLYWYSRPRGVGKAEMISQISFEVPSHLLHCPSPTIIKNLKRAALVGARPVILIHPPDAYSRGNTVSLENKSQEGSVLLCVGLASLKRIPPLYDCRQPLLIFTVRLYFNDTVRRIHLGSLRAVSSNTALYSDRKCCW